MQPTDIREVCVQSIVLLVRELFAYFCYSGPRHEHYCRPGRHSHLVPACLHFTLPRPSSPPTLYHGTVYCNVAFPHDLAFPIRQLVYKRRVFCKNVVKYCGIVTCKTIHDVPPQAQGRRATWKKAAAMKIGVMHASPPELMAGTELLYFVCTNIMCTNRTMCQQHTVQTTTFRQRFVPSRRHLAPNFLSDVKQTHASISGVQCLAASSIV